MNLFQVAYGESPGVLGCMSANYFWLSWKANMVSFGREWSIGSNTLVSWKEPDMPYQVNAIGLYGESWGTWEFTDKPGNSLFALEHKLVTQKFQTL